MAFCCKQSNKPNSILEIALSLKLLSLLETKLALCRDTNRPLPSKVQTLTTSPSFSSSDQDENLDFQPTYIYSVKHQREFAVKVDRNSSRTKPGEIKDEIAGFQDLKTQVCCAVTSRSKWARRKRNKCEP